MAATTANEVAQEDISEQPDVSAPATPDIGGDDDNRGIEQQGPHVAVSAASGSSLSVSIELPAVNKLDEKKISNCKRIVRH